MWYSPIAVSIVLLVGTVVSYVTGPRKPHEIDSNLIISVSDLNSSCVPNGLQKWFQRGTKHEAHLEVKVRFVILSSWSIG